MPVTVQVASVESNGHDSTSPSPRSAEHILKALGPEYSSVRGGVLQHCVPEEDMSYMTTHRNGFVRCVLDAYAGHHHLVLRPDDVWIAILSQFNYYLQSHPDVARSHFVPSHQPGSNKLDHSVYFLGSSKSVSVAGLASQMTKEVQAKVAEPAFRDFILPSFTTTTLDDKVICATMMLSSLESFFDTSITLMCGIPSITLLGAEPDWADLVTRIQPIVSGQFGDNDPALIRWGQMLQVILTRFQRAFVDSIGDQDWKGGQDRDFWTSVVRYKRNYSERGAASDNEGRIGGWITAFTRWTPTALPPDATSEGAKSKLPSGASLFDSVEVLPDEDAPSNSPQYSISTDSGVVSFPLLRPSRIPSSLAVLPFKLTDNGLTVEARLLAGHIGKTWFGMKEDRVQPLPGWLLYLPVPPEQRNRAKSPTPEKTEDWTGLGGAVKRANTLKTRMMADGSGPARRKPTHQTSQSLSYPLGAGPSGSSVYYPGVGEKVGGAMGIHVADSGNVVVGPGAYGVYAPTDPRAGGDSSASAGAGKAKIWQKVSSHMRKWSRSDAKG